MDRYWIETYVDERVDLPALRNGPEIVWKKYRSCDSEKKAFHDAYNMGVLGYSVRVVDTDPDVPTCADGRIVAEWNC